MNNIMEDYETGEKIQYNVYGFPTLGYQAEFATGTCSPWFENKNDVHEYVAELLGD